MKLLDVMKPCEPELHTGFSLNQNLQIGTIGIKMIPQDKKEIYITDEKRNTVGKISALQLLFLEQYNGISMGAQLLDHLEHAVTAVSEDGRIFYGNKAYGVFCNKPLNQLIGTGLQETPLDMILKEGLKMRQLYQKENLYVPSLNKIASIKAFPLFQASGFQGICAIIKDITQPVKQKRELEKTICVADYYKAQVQVQSTMKELQFIGQDAKFVHFVSQILTAAKTDVPVLIQGERGTGKATAVRLLHNSSKRKDRPFITVNCAATPGPFIERELFYCSGDFMAPEKGSGYMGKVQLAEGGTLFLEEIEAMPLSTQAKLLHFMEENTAQLGQPQVDLRIVASAIEPLETLVQEKRFLKKLYYHFNLFYLRAPALRERPYDIAILTNAMSKKLSEKYGKEVCISKQVYRKLEDYYWPGNISELWNVMERAAVQCGNSVITEDCLWFDNMKETEEVSEEPCENVSKMALKDMVKVYERRMICQVMDETKGDKAKAMERLGLARRTFYRKLEEHRIKE